MYKNIIERYRSSAKTIFSKITEEKLLLINKYFMVIKRNMRVAKSSSSPAV